MGTINPDIDPKYIEPIEEILKPFLFGFNISYGSIKKAANTTLFVYILQPEDFMKEAYGFDKEVFMAYSQYDNLEARTIQAVEILLNQHPFKNRVDNLNYFFVSNDTNVEEWIKQHFFSTDSYPLPVSISAKELVEHKNDSWYIRNKLTQNFFGTDLFGYTLPIQDDTRFFGRQQILSRYIDAIRRGENRGLFGLRKTGKTSFLFKLERVIREQKIGYTFFYDCKAPANRKLHWNDFLGMICSDIARSLNIKIRKEYDETNIYKSLQYVVTTAAQQGKKIVLLFDEIEFISFNTSLDEHWKKEFIDFWQTLWALQSRNRNVSFILCGVNPTIIETDTINGVQNPLFGIVQSEYMQGLDFDEMKIMIKYLGKRMGLKFSYESIVELYEHYNGHPLLTRLACSQINNLTAIEDKPANIELKDTKIYLNDINSELKYYFRHVVSEIRQFYPDEYSLLETLATGQIAEFIEYSKISEFVTHLYSYGLVANDEYNRPKIKLKVAGEYVAMDLAKKEGRTIAYKVVDKEKRETWVKLRIQSIINDMRQLELIISKRKEPKIFGENSFPEADRFFQIVPVLTPKDFDSFINVVNRCFVESVENYGKSIGDNNYFWGVIKTTYPTLFDALERIKVYRHYHDHLVLNEKVSTKLLEFIDEDGEGIADLNERTFCIQQKLLELLFSSIQIEFDKLS